MNEEYIKKLEETNKELIASNGVLQDRVNKLEDTCRKYKTDRSILISQLKAFEQDQGKEKKDPEGTLWVELPRG
jgi:hypothetical protein